MGTSAATGIEAAILAIELRWAARAEATAGSSAGTLAPLGKSTSLVSKLKAPDLKPPAAKVAAAPTGAELAIAAFELRCTARAETTAGSSTGTLAPLGKSTSIVFKLKAPDLKAPTAAPTGAESAIESFELRCAARAEATAGS